MTTVPPPFGRTVPGNRWDLLDGVVAPRRTVSVVVAHYDQPRQLARTLAALGRQTYPPDLVQVVVADDGSPTPPTVPDGVTLVRQEDRGFRLAAVRNLGATHSTGDLLCFLDADTSPEPDYLDRLTRLPALLPEAVTVGRRRHADLSAGPSDDPLADGAARHPLPEPAWLTDAYRDSRDLLDADDRSYRFVIGAVVACTRWFFDEVGGFDETFGAYGGEDWEWAHRAWAAGAVLAHVPDAVAWHDGPEWADRPDDAERSSAAERAGRRRARKNSETLRLATAIPVTGSRPHAILTRAADTVVVLEAATSAAAAFVCVDSVLAALPHARVVVPADVAGIFDADPRVAAEAWSGPWLVEVRLAREVRVADPGPLRAAVADVRATRGPGVVRLGDAVTFTSARAAHRRRRWGADAAVIDEARPAAGVATIPDEPDLEAYLGGWG